MQFFLIVIFAAMEASNKKHWDTVYETKNVDQVSWTQEMPQISLSLIHSFDLPKTASIIDIGGGDSKLVDHLLAEGYNNMTVLDISVKALEKAKRRLGDKTDKIKWIVTDILNFQPGTTYDLWHDRATFHFLTAHTEIKKYVDIATACTKRFAIIGTFSEKGPEKCSGLTVKRYGEEALASIFEKDFIKINSMTEDHLTPFKTKQNFLFLSFKRRSDQELKKS